MKKNLIIFTLFLLIASTFGGCISSEKNPDEEDNRKSIEIYTLQEAYDNQLLTKEDLMSIAYYHNGGRIGNENIMGENYTPIVKTPETLSAETEILIRKAYLKIYIINYGSSGVSVENIGIGKYYYGTYNNCVAAMLWCSDMGYADVVWQESVCGVQFNYTNGNRILISANN